MRSRSSALGSLLATACALGVAGPAQAATDFTPLAEKRSTLTVPEAGAAACDTRLPAGAGVATRAWEAPAEGFLTARLSGARGDWDLAVFDAATGVRLGSSQGFRADEVVQSWARAGQRLVVQACRRPGAGRTATLGTEYAVGAWPASPGKVQVVRIPLTDPRSQVPLLEALGFDVEEAVFPTHAFATITDPLQLGVLKAAGFAVNVVKSDLVASIENNLRLDRRRALASRGGSNLPSGRAEYRVFEDYQRELKKLVADNPGLVKPVTLPKRTFQGRDTIGVEISGNVDATDDQKPVSFVMGVHHAREWPAGEVVQELALHLAAQYGKDARVTQLLDRVRVVVVPLINADGFIASRSAVDPADALGDPDIAPELFGPGLAPSLAEGALIPAGGILAYRRKNCRGVDPGGTLPCELTTGVDPNRNYGFKWGGPGASTSPNSQTYRGEGPWSEPETQAVHEFSQVRDVTSLMTVHTIAALVLRPPGLGVDGVAPDEAALKALGDGIASDTGYKSQFGYELYDTSGTTEDWNYGAAGTYGYTIELGPGDAGFHGDYQSNVIDQWNGTGEQAGKGMRAAFLRLAEAAGSGRDFSTIAGRAPAGRTLRIKKTFKTATSPICTIASPLDIRNDAYACVAPTPPQLVDDKLEYTTKVASNGTFSWLVTPSTPPFTRAKGITESWTLTCEDAAGQVLVTRQVTVDRNETQTLELPCGGSLPGRALTETKFTTDAPGAAGAAAKAALAAAAAASSSRDKLAPRSRFTRSRLKATRNNGLLLNGTSKDLAPSGMTPKLAKVDVSVGRRTGTQCRFLTAKGKLGPKGSCRRAPYVPAKGTSTWSFVSRATLPPGKYLAWVRGTDAARNVERKANSRNLVTFTVK